LKTSSEVLVLVDGHALVHRAYHAIPAGFMTSRGEPTNAVYGFTSMLLRVLQEIRPEYAAVTFDRSAPTFRHLASADYKATRPRTADELRQQFGRVRQVVEAFNIPIYEMDGYEADDLLGCLAHQAERSGVDTIIVTADLDTLQLVTDHVRVLASRGRISDTVLYDVDAVHERYGLAPGQIPDMKALAGDPSDNIKGISGIGPKTAAKLLGDFGSVEGLYDRLDHVPPKFRNVLAENERLVRSNKRLASIERTVPCLLDLERCRLADYDRDAALRLFQELEFRSLLGKLPSSVRSDTVRQLDLFDTPSGAGGTGPRHPIAPSSPFAPAPAAAPAATLETKNSIVTSEEALAGVVAALRQAGTFVFHPVFTKQSPIDFVLAGYALGVDTHTAWYVPVDGQAADDLLQDRMAIDALRLLLEDPSIEKVIHDAKPAITLLAERDVTLRGLAFDPMIAAYLLNPSIRSTSVRDLVFQQLGREIEGTNTLVPERDTVRGVPEQRLAQAALLEVQLVAQLTEILRRDLIAREQLELLTRVELPLIPVLSSLERTGVKVDTHVLGAISRDLAGQIRQTELDTYNSVGHQFTISSTQQLGKVLTDELHLPLTKRTKTGYSTDATVLEELRGTHPVIELVLTYRQLTKLKSTYIDALPALINPRTGRIHTTFNQTVTSTGRLSSEAPNFQNIPIRTEIGREIRRAFVAGQPDRVLFAADYAQIELRIAAHITQDPLLVQAFELDEDIHTATAATLFDVPLEAVSPHQRRVAKTTNFAILYGISDFGLAQRLGLSRREADKIIKEYLGRYAGVRRYIDTTLKQARERGYVETPLGRRRYLPEIRSTNAAVRAAGERQAINMPIQGAQADLIKLAMIAIHGEIERRALQSKMILQVHDELVFEVPRDELDTVASLVRREMEGAMTLSVPIKVEMKAGINWYEMIPLDGPVRSQNSP
jgi:DNA polymerase I